MFYLALLKLTDLGETCTALFIYQTQRIQILIPNGKKLGESFSHAYVEVNFSPVQADGIPSNHLVPGLDHKLDA